MRCRHLAALPLPPRVGKMLLYGILFEVLDPILTVACCMAYRYTALHLHSYPFMEQGWESVEGFVVLNSAESHDPLKESG